MQTFKLNCNIASASQYNDCLGTRSKASSFLLFHSDPGCIKNEASIILFYHLTGIYAAKMFSFIETEILNNKLGNTNS